MVASNLTLLAFAVFFTICFVNSTAAVSPPTAMSSAGDEDFEEIYLDNEDELDQLDEDSFSKRGLPKLRRIFIGKREPETSAEWFVSQKRVPRRHLFLGKREPETSGEWFLSEKRVPRRHLFLGKREPENGAVWFVSHKGNHPRKV